MTNNEIEGAIVDLDGTVYRGDALIPGAAAAIESLRARDVPLLFLTNKAIHRRATFRRTLNDLGIPATDDEILNSATITARYLAQTHPDASVFVVGEPPLTEELTHHDLTVTKEPASTDVLLASMDRSFDYRTLGDAADALDDDTPFLATNPDRTCPVEGGEIPDCAAMVGAIEGATGHRLDAVLGKPADTAVEVAAETLGVPLERCLMVGDRLETDVEMGVRNGMVTALVLTGVTDAAIVETADIEPDFVLDSIADLDEALGPRP